MTMDSGQPATSAVSSGQGTPPAGMVIRRSRSLSELPGSLRVPIIARRGDGDRMRVRLEASREGLEELKMLREQQQQLVDQVKAASSQRRGSSSRQNHARRASASMRSSTASLARISEDGPLDTSLSGNLGSRDENLRDFTNLPPHGWGDWRNTQTGRSRRPLSMSDSCFLEGALYVEAKQSGTGGHFGGTGDDFGGAGGNFGAAGSSLRKVRSLDSFGPDRSVPAPQSARRASTQGLYRSDSYRDTTSTSPSHTAGPYGQYRTFAGIAASDGGRTSSALSSPAGSTLSLHRADLSSDYTEHEAVATFEGKTRKVGRSHSFSVGPGPSLGVGLGLGSAPRGLESPGGQILPTAAMESLYGSENMEPKLRRASLQCEAVLTGSSGRQRDVFRDVDIRCDFPSPLHAVLRQYNGAKGSTPSPRPNSHPQSSPTSKTSMTLSQTQLKTSIEEEDAIGSHSNVNSGSKASSGMNVSAFNNNVDASASVSMSSMTVQKSPTARVSPTSSQSAANSSSPVASCGTSPGSASPRYQDSRAANGTSTDIQTNKTCSGQCDTFNNASGSHSYLSNSSTVTPSTGLHHVASCPATFSASPVGGVSATGSKASTPKTYSSATDGRSISERGPRYTSCTTGHDPRQQAHGHKYSRQDGEAAPRDLPRNLAVEMSAKKEGGKGDVSRNPENSDKPRSPDTISPQIRSDRHSISEQKTGDRLMLEKNELMSNISDLSRTAETPRVSAKRLRARSLNEIPEALRRGPHRSDANWPSDKQRGQLPRSSKGNHQNNAHHAGFHDAKSNYNHRESEMLSRGARHERPIPPSYSPNPAMSEQYRTSPPRSPSHDSRKEENIQGRADIPTPRSSSDDVFESQPGHYSQSSPSPNTGKVSPVRIFYPENPGFKIQDWYSVGSSGSVREGSTDEVFVEEQTTSGCKLLRARISPTSSSSQLVGGTPGNETNSASENRRSNNSSPNSYARELPESSGSTSIQHGDRLISHTNTNASSNVNSLFPSESKAVDPSSSAEYLPASASLESPQEDDCVNDARAQAAKDNTNENVNFFGVTAAPTSPSPIPPDTLFDNEQPAPAHDVYNNNTNNNSSNDNNMSNTNVDDKGGEEQSGLQGSSDSVEDQRNTNENNNCGPMPSQYRPPLSSTNPFSPQNRSNTNPFTNQPVQSTNPFLSQPLSPSNPFIQPPLSSTNPFVQQPLSPTNPFADQLNASRVREATLGRKNPGGSHQDEGYITSSPETPRGRHCHKYSFLSDSSATSAEMDESPPLGETTPGVDPTFPPPLPSDDGSTQIEAVRASNGNPKHHVTKVSLPFRQTDL